ncbi:MAG: acetyl-CoA carboxylase biotin carboxyl carrier protein subunit [Flavobacteriales bacterium]
MLQIKVNNQEIKTLSLSSSAEVEMLEPGRFLLRKDNKVFEIFLLGESEDGNEMEIQINQHYFKVNIQNELDQLLNSLGFKSSDVKKVKELKSPMPGKIVAVMVNEGDEVKPGQPLLILEAMKMENALQAISEGKVEKIMVEKGTSVNKNDILIKFA